MTSRCDDCGLVHDDDVLLEPRNLFERLDPGGPSPSGECPECGALCYPADGRGAAAATPPAPAGAWRLEEHERPAFGGDGRIRWADVLDERGVFVCRVDYPWPLDRRAPAQARARLIAAAPALLEALRQALDVVEEARDEALEASPRENVAFWTEGAGRHAIDQARAALAAAGATALSDTP
jgi:hypothetical protein